MTARLLGGTLLAAAGALLGHSRLTELKSRLRLLRELSAALGLMQSELTALLTPLPQIFQRLRDRPFFELLAAGFGNEPTEQLWRRAAESLPIGETDRAALAALAPVVGRFGAEKQAAELDLVRRTLETSGDALEREIAGRAKSFAGLGAALGAMLAVILL